MPMFTLVLLLLSPQHAPSELTRETLDAFAAQIVPSDGELRFEDIDWRPTFLTAVTEARTSDKPVLLWAMNGHPLGCT